MATRERPADAAAADARRQLVEIGREIRTARITLGISLARAARRLGLSASQQGRIERGELRRVSFDHLMRAAKAVGLDLRLRAYPSEAPVRDRGQLAALGRFERMLGRPLTLRREAPLPLPGDRRAWDGAIDGGDRPARVECEVHLTDLQALERRIALKLRDDPGVALVILVVSRSAHNRAVLGEHREGLRGLFPLDRYAVARGLRAGRLPSHGAIVIV